MPDENSLGVVAIHAGTRVLYLNRVQNKKRRSPEVVSVIRSAYQAQCTQVTKPEAEKQRQELARERSRSPNKDAAKDKPKEKEKEKSKEAGPFGPFMDKVTSLDTGGGGNCGYTCLAAALALDKGESIEQVKGDLPARARTIRHDLYKHLDKYASEYQEYFVPAESEETIDAGPSPTTWEEYLECTLREGRWIDGLSLRAASKRYGMHIIVIPLEGEEKDKPMAFGTPRSGREPIVLLLNDRQGHYTLLQLKAGRQWSKEWTQAAQASVASVALRGGGKSPAPARSCASSAHSWRPAHTPESKTKTIKRNGSVKSHGASWRPACTPESSRKLPACYPNSHRSTLTRNIKSCTKTAMTVNKPKSKTVSSAVRSVQPVDTGNRKQNKKKGTRATHVSEQFVWTCNLCQQVFRYHNKKSIASARLRHIKKEHPKKAKAVHACFPRPITQIANASGSIPESQRAWTCSKCGEGLAYMPRHQLKISRDAHVIRCYGITKAKLKKLHYNSPIWRGIHAQLVKSNAEKKIKRNDSLIESYNQSTQAGAFRIPQGFLSDCINFSCGTCTLVFQKLSYLLQHECGGHAARPVHMARGSRQNLWLRCRQKEDQKAVKLLARHWKLSHQEINVLEKAGTDKKLPPLPAQVWQRDHTEDGDVEPNPGPSSCRHMHGITINVNGPENSWACARWICKEKPAIAILQEHCMLPDKQADLSRFMQAKGYRSWFVAPPASHSVLGHAYTSGGVAIFVRKDKGAREVNRHVAYDGQAIMLQLDHMFIIGAYLPPRNSQATQTLTVLDEWIASAGALEPVVILGDFNQEPELADRWTALADGGAAKVVSLPDGTRASTRWEGNRCIDWIWSSHPFMVDELAFSEAVFSDHKALTFNLQYRQDLRISNLLKLFRSFGRLSGKETGHPCRKLFSFGRKAVSPCRNMPGQTSHLRNFTDKQSE